MQLGSDNTVATGKKQSEHGMVFILFFVHVLRMKSTFFVVCFNFP